MHAKKRDYIVKGFMGGYGIDRTVVNNTFFNTYDMREYPIFNSIVEKEINKCDSFKFTMGATHSFIDAVQPYRNWVMVVQYAGYINTEGESPIWEQLDEDVLFFGRVIEVDKDLYGNKDITCEGSLGYLNDIPIRVKDMKSWAYSTRGVAFGITHAQDEAYSRGPENDILSSDIMITKSFKDFHIKRDSGGYPIGVDGVTIYDDSESSDIKNDVSVLSLMDFLNQYSLNLVGGAYYLDCDYKDSRTQNIIASPIDVGGRDRINSVINYLHYREATDSFGLGYGLGGGGMVYYPGYPNLEPEDYPRFVMGENIVSISKEPAMETIYTGVFPVGKNGMVLSNNVPVDPDDSSYYDTNYIFHTASVNKYGRTIISLDYNNVTDKTTLRRLATNWINTHASDGLINEHKYTITGPEPIVLGYGNFFIKPLYGILYAEDSVTSLDESKVYPCLSMKVDISNPQNNQYTFGPFVSDNYTETTISRRAGNR